MHGPDLSEAKLVELFPIPLLSYKWPDGEALGLQLTDVILRRMKQSSGVQRTNKGGWHSESDFQDWPDPCVRELNSRILAFTKEMVRRTTRSVAPGHLDGWTIDAWANVNTAGAFNVSHRHLGGSNVWSGVFYVTTGGI